MKRSELKPKVWWAMENNCTHYYDAEKCDEFTPKNDDQRIKILLVYIQSHMNTIGVYEDKKWHDISSACKRIYATPNIVALIERMSSFKLDNSPVMINNVLQSISKVGVTEITGHEVEVYRDINASSDYILICGDEASFYMEVYHLDDIICRIFPLHYPEDSNYYAKVKFHYEAKIEKKEEN